MVNWLLAHLPWYDVEVQTGREAESKALVARAHVVRISAERVFSDYKAADEARKNGK
jgi:hypothetical protein